MKNTRIIDLESNAQIGSNTCWAQVLETLDMYFNPLNYESQFELIKSAKKCEVERCCADLSKNLYKKCDIHGVAFPDVLKNKFSRSSKQISTLSFEELKFEIIENIDKGQPIIFSSESPDKTYGHSLLIKGYSKLPQTTNILLWVVDPTIKNGNVLMSAESLFYAKVKKMDLFISDIQSLSTKKRPNYNRYEFNLRDLLSCHFQWSENATFLMQYLNKSPNDLQSLLGITAGSSFEYSNRTKILVGENGKDELSYVPIFNKETKQIEFVLEIETYGTIPLYRFSQTSEYKIKCTGRLN